jgi:hypothetical protein
MSTSIKAFGATQYENSYSISEIKEVVLCKYVPVGVFQLKSLNRPEDTVLINPNDNPLMFGNVGKRLEEPDCNGFISMTLEWNKAYYV